MAIGPAQLIVLGFDHPQFHGEIIAELGRLRESDTVRVTDSLAVYKDAGGELEVEAGALAGAEAAVEAGGVNVFSDDDGWDVLEDIPKRLGRRAAAARAPLGRSRSETRSRAPAGSASAGDSSARSTSSTSALSRPRRRSNFTPTETVAAGSTQ